jgi:hypothetical protein
VAAATAGHSGQRQQRGAGTAASGAEAHRRSREQTCDADPPQRTGGTASRQPPVDGSGPSHGADGTDGALVLFRQTTATRYGVTTDSMSIYNMARMNLTQNFIRLLSKPMANVTYFMRSGTQRGEKEKRSKKSKRKRSKKSRRREESSDSSVMEVSSDESESEEEVRKKRRKKDKRPNKRKHAKKAISSSSDEASDGSSEDESESSTSSSSGGSGSETAKRNRQEKRRKKRRKHREMVWQLLAEAWPIEERPMVLRKKNGIGNRSLDELLRYKESLDKQREKRDLGEEVCSKDMKPIRVRYKAQTDDSVKKLHLSRFERQPLTHPKNYFHLIPQKREVVVRNFPMEHLGITGQVSDVVIGKLHNRKVKLTFDMFAKSTQKEARGQSKAGKYSNAQQIREGLINYCLMLLSLWPHDYAGLVVFKVLNEANFGEDATSDAKRRAELCAELFNAVLADNSAKAVHQDYPAVYEQVTAVYNLLDTLAFALLTGWFTSHTYQLLGFKTLYQDLLSETSPNKPDEISYLTYHSLVLVPDCKGRYRLLFVQDALP